MPCPGGKSPLGRETLTEFQRTGTYHALVAVISVGTGNTYGHPRREVLARPQESGINTYRTELNGAVTFYLDGKKVSACVADLR